jgi:hypothetical protein
LLHFAKAATTFEKIIALKLTHPSAYRFVAKTRLLLGDDDGARGLLREARKRFPLDPSIARTSAGLDYMRIAAAYISYWHARGRLR